MIATETARLCATCGDPSRPGYLYCKPCSKARLDRLQAAGYLTPVPRRRRVQDGQEYDPRYDSASPYQEVAIRAMEGG
jgi:hypothetical protein